MGADLSELCRRRQMPTAVNFRSPENRYFLRLYHQTVTNFIWTLPAALARDLAALAYALLRDPKSRAAFRRLWDNRDALWERRRRIQARRTVSTWRLDRWLPRHGVPV